jgi:hypothetical protein
MAEKNIFPAGSKNEIEDEKNIAQSVYDSEDSNELLIEEKRTM